MLTWKKTTVAIIALAISYCVNVQQPTDVGSNNMVENRITDLPKSLSQIVTGVQPAYAQCPPPPLVVRLQNAGYLCQPSGNSWICAPQPSGPTIQISC